MVILHPHKGCVMICFGKAVSVTQNLLIFGILAAFCENLRALLIISLQLCFTLSSAVDKLNFSFIDLNGQILQCFYNTQKVMGIFFS